jgi:hypothetical protein
LGRVAHQRLGIGVDGDKVNSAQTLGNHTIDSIATTAAHANNFNLGEILRLYGVITFGHVVSSFE